MLVRMLKTRFSIRVLLSSVGLTSIMIAVWTNEVRTQNGIVNDIQQLGGEVYFLDFCKGRAYVQSRYSMDIPKWLRPICLMRVNFIKFESNGICDDQVRELISLRGLKGLSLNGTSVTDKTIERLIGMRLLELNLYGVEGVSEHVLRRFRAANPQCTLGTDFQFEESQTAFGQNTQKTKSPQENNDKILSQ